MLRPKGYEENRTRRRRPVVDYVETTIVKDITLSPNSHHHEIPKPTTRLNHELIRTSRDMTSQKHYCCTITQNRYDLDDIKLLRLSSKVSPWSYRL